MRFCLFEDRAETLEPLCLARPVFDLRCGITTLACKIWRHVSASMARGMLVRSSLEALCRSQHPGLAVNDWDWLRADDLLLLNGRWLPPDEPFALPTDSCVGLAGNDVAYLLLRKKDVPAVTYDGLPMMLEHWRHTLPGQPVGGGWITYPWDLVEQNAGEIQRDFQVLGNSSCHADRLANVGSSDRLWIASSARVEPMVVADTTRGPVVIDEDAVVTAFTRLEGPCYIGPKSQVFGAKIGAGTTLGPQCRVGGEVEATIVHGYSNKHHDGFLGHSYVGEWVNLGAGTQNSDLRNDYGEVTVFQHGEPVRTGLNKVGCFLGDHTKTGLGTLLNTGTNVGVFANLLPVGRLAPKYVPSFASWWNGALCEAFTLEQLLTTAQIAMQRRGVSLTEAHRDLYTWLLNDTAQERRRALRDSEQRHLRRAYRA